MNSQRMLPQTCFLLLALASCFSLVGCTPNIQYPDHLLAEYRAQKEVGNDYMDLKVFVASSLSWLFGTIETPTLPDDLRSDLHLSDVLDINSIRRAAGPVGRNADGIESGVFRKHCTICHGLGGDGLGPSAMMLAPYPRDYRRGTFKFATSGQGKPPSHDDLVRIITDGIPGTAMPAMAALANDPHFKEDIEVLADYVVFLAIRGEVERRIWLEFIPELSQEEMNELAKVRDANDLTLESKQQLLDIVQTVGERWRNLAPTPNSVSSLAFQWPEDLESEKHAEMLASAKRGADLFQSETTACVQCHGATGNGDGRLNDFDEWTKDWTFRAGVDPRNPEQWKPLKRLGLLKPIVDQPRNLHYGAFRGGDDPYLIFNRLANGIAGTPMPAIPRIESSPVGLREDQIWDLVNFCQSLAFEETNRSEL